MRFATVFVLGAAVVSTCASLVVRQSNVPTCYLNCVAQANLTACGNDATNTLCICKNAGIVSATTACIESTCTGANLTAAIADATSVCEAVGVTLSASGTSSGSSASATASTTASTTASASASTATASTAAAASAHGANAFISLAAVVGLIALAL